MKLVSETIGGVAVIRLEGESLDALAAPEFRRAVGERVAGGKVLLDLEELRFVDSSGLGAVLACLRQLNACDGELKLCNMRKEVRATFELVRMHRLIDIHESREAALGAFGTAAGAPQDPLGLGR